MSEGQQQTAQLSKIHRRMKKEEAPGILISKIRGIPTTDRQAGSAGSVTDILTRIRENKEKPSPDKQTPAAIDKAPLRDRMSRVRFGRPATARQAESEISAQHIEALRLWSNITGIQIEFLARNDNLKKVQHQANIISLKQQQEKEWRKAADRMPGDMYREAVQRDTAPLASEQETKRARTVGSAPAVYHKDQGIQGYDPSADGTDTSPYPHILPEVENLYTPFKGIL